MLARSPSAQAIGNLFLLGFMLYISYVQMTNGPLLHTNQAIICVFIPAPLGYTIFKSTRAFILFNVLAVVLFVLVGGGVGLQLRWVDGRVALMGDAAHAMYPTGSNGASQAIVDARVLGAACLAHGAQPAAIDAYNASLCEPVSALVLRNRNAGPFGLLNLVDARCGGVFEDIDAVVPQAERNAFMAQYKASAGFAMDALNAAPSTVPARP